MNEYWTGLLVVFSQLGVVLALIAVAAIIYFVVRKAKDNNLAREFINTLKQSELGRKDTLSEALQKVHNMEPKEANDTVQMMLGSEKRIYNRALKLFLGHDRDSLRTLQKDVENMAAEYRKLVAKSDNVQIIERGDNPKIEAQLRMTIKQLTAERDKLQKDLDEAMSSMENMLKEYTSMYAGGAKKEGVKHIENELSMLKQKIDNNLVEMHAKDDDGEDGGDVPDMSAKES